MQFRRSLRVVCGALIAMLIQHATVVAEGRVLARVIRSSTKIDQSSHKVRLSRSALHHRKVLVKVSDATTLTMELRFKAPIDRVVATKAGARLVSVSSGYLLGVEKLPKIGSSTALSFRKRNGRRPPQVFGRLIEGTTEYKLFSRGGSYWIQISSNKDLPESADAVTPPVPSPIEDTSSPDLPVGDVVTVVDVGLIYTERAQQAVGGAEMMVLEAAAVMEETNAIYLQSGTGVQFSLAYLGTTTSLEGVSLLTDLTELYKYGDGRFEEVFPARRDNKLDLVSLIVSRDDGVACGYGYKPRSIGDFDAAAGLSVVARNCLANFTLAHELGHNFGADHDRANSNPVGLYSYGHGFHFYGNDGFLYRTVMAYAPGARIPYFSSPALQFQGQATGTEDENNAQVVRSSAGKISAYSDTVVKFGSPSGGPKLGKVRGVKVLAKNATSNCVVSGQIVDDAGVGVGRIRTRIVAPKTLRELSVASKTDTNGKFKIRTNARVRAKIMIYSLELKILAGPFVCKIGK